MTEPIIAYRTWNLIDGQLRAVGMTSAPPWPVRQRLDAKCEYSDPLGPTTLYAAAGVARKQRHLEAVPLSSCSCGAYGFKELDLTLDHLRTKATGLASVYHTVSYANRVAGRVSLWGTIIECERGYRAQYAYPAVLYYGPHNEAEVKAAASAYAIDALPWPEAIATEMGAAEERRVKYEAQMAAVKEAMGDRIGGTYVDYRGTRHFVQWSLAPATRSHPFKKFMGGFIPPHRQKGK